MILALQILVLFIGAGGSIVTAFTLPESRTKWAVVSTFGVAGVVGLFLTVLTYEQLTFADIGTWTWSYLQLTWSYLTALGQRRWVQISLTAIICIAIGAVGPRAYDKYKIRKWYSSYDIFQLADPKLMKDAEIAEGDIERLAAQITALGIERQNFGKQSDGSLNIDTSALEVLQANIREASARNSAAYELRERARLRASRDVYEKLRLGKLIAKGFISPAGSNSKEIIIPAGHWKLIRFNGDYTEASNNNIRYVGIEITKA